MVDDEACAVEDAGFFELRDDVGAFLTVDELAAAVDNPDDCAAVV